MRLIGVMLVLSAATVLSSCANLAGSQLSRLDESERFRIEITQGCLPFVTHLKNETQAMKYIGFRRDGNIKEVSGSHVYRNRWVMQSDILTLNTETNSCRLHSEEPDAARAYKLLNRIFVHEFGEDYKEFALDEVLAKHPPDEIKFCLGRLLVYFGPDRGAGQGFAVDLRASDICKDGNA